jgi:hypothetical protein
MVVHVQDVRDGSIPRNTEVTLKGVFVTAVSRSIAGADFWVQEAQGVTTASHDYPQYAGMQVFIGPILAGTSFDVQRAKPGDCIDLTGPVGMEENFPELGDVDQFVPRDAASCGTPPEPLVIDTDEAFAGIATDADPQTDGAQPGANTASMNGLLMAVPAVTATFVGSLSLSIPGVGMRVQRPGSDVMLVVFPPLASSFSSPTQGQTVSVTGVFSNAAYLSNGSAGLVPRTIDDIVTSP